MQRPVPWFWLIALALLLVAPGLTARLFVDVIEGVTLVLVLGPLVLAGVAVGQTQDDDLPCLRHTQPGGSAMPRMRRQPGGGCSFVCHDG
jgi:hypothetical protein